MGHHPHGDPDFNFINHDETLRLAETAEALSRVIHNMRDAGGDGDLHKKIEGAIGTIVDNIQHRTALVSVIEEDHA